MKTFFRNKGDKGGIYKISNAKNGRVYYGSTSRFKTRAYSHKNDLLKNRHRNTFLQNDYNKCGEDAFTFEVLEVVEGKQKFRIEKEQKYLNEFYDNQKHCYNLSPTAGESRLGSGNKRPYDPETDGRATSRTPEVIAVVSEKNKKAWNTPEKKKEASKNARKRWDKHSADITVTNKNTGECVVIKGSIRAWCEERGLSYKSFHLMVKGKTKSSGGWFLGKTEPKYVVRKGEKRKPLSKEHKAKIAGGKYKGTVLKHKETGETFTIGSNIKEDCKERNISYSSLQKMLNGKCKSASGWINA